MNSEEFKKAFNQGRTRYLARWDQVVAECVADGHGDGLVAAFLMRSLSDCFQYCIDRGITFPTPDQVMEALPLVAEVWEESIQEASQIPDDHEGGET